MVGGNNLKKIICLMGPMLCAFISSTWAQPAPALRAVVRAEAAPHRMIDMFSRFDEEEKRISVPGAAWLQLQFSEVQLGYDGKLIIIDSSGEQQTFSQTQIDDWGGLSAVFNGSELRVKLEAGSSAKNGVSARIEEIVVGLPTSAINNSGKLVLKELRDLLDQEIEHFIPGDLLRSSKKGDLPNDPAMTKSICGPTDNRGTLPLIDWRVGRIMPAGCTGWLIPSGKLLTAGHCVSPDMKTIEFQVPASKPDGTPVAPLVRNQYRVKDGSIISKNTGEGNDWAVFRVSPNTETGQMPSPPHGMGHVFELSNTLNPSPPSVMITGYGLDGPPPRFGDGGPRNAESQIQQVHVGNLSQNTGSATFGLLRHDVDTQPGNSGSPVFVPGNRDTAIGIHTHGGCDMNAGSNAGTSFRNGALWNAINSKLDIP